MDAYSSYILQLSNARAGELRREAAEYALSRTARRRRSSRRARIGARLAWRRRAVVEPVAPLPLPVVTVDDELRRSA